MRDAKRFLVHDKTAFYAIRTVLVLPVALGRRSISAGGGSRSQLHKTEQHPIRGSDVFR